LKAKDARKHQQSEELWDFVMRMFDGARNQHRMEATSWPILGFGGVVRS